MELHVHFCCSLLLIVLGLGGGGGALALSHDGKILMQFKRGLVNAEQVLPSWRSRDHSPCRWAGVRCDSNNSRVTYLNLPHQQLSGLIPAELGKLTQLRRLGLHENMLVGPIPTELRHLRFLRALYLRGNELNGSIPSELGRLSDIAVLDLSRNNLTGAIPESLGDLLKLRFLNVSSNFLRGPIPTNGSLSNFTTSSFIGNMGLCGPQINKSCLVVPSPSPSPLLIPAAMEPAPCPGILPLLRDQEAEERPKNFLNALLITITGASLLFGLFSMCAYLFLYRKHNSSNSKRLSFVALDHDKSCPSFGAPDTKLVMFHGDLPYPSKEVVKKIELLDATDIIGSGGFGTVYRLVMDDGSWFAVKKIDTCSLGGSSERLFERELEILGSFKHRNLVNLRGYCNSPTSKLLIYDYLPYGSLDDFLHERGAQESLLNWSARLDIAVGTARALSYLHHDCNPRIIHRDVKSSNILLDEHMEAHVSDFGLAKLLDCGESHVTTIVAGTFGYLAPEYMNTGRATEKGDVYSYGVVLLELISGKRPTELCFIEKGLNVVGWVGTCIRENRHKEVFDPKCPGAQKESMESLLQIAVMCVSADPDDRPTMEQVLQMLQQPGSFSPCPSELEYDSPEDFERSPSPKIHSR